MTCVDEEVDKETFFCEDSENGGFRFCAGPSIEIQINNQTGS